MLRFRPYLEWKNAVDEYADEYTVGVFVGGWCLIGFRHQPPHKKTIETGEGEMYGFVFLNCSIGVWRDPNPELPPSGWE